MSESRELALENRQSKSPRRRKTFLDRVSRTRFVQGWYAVVLSFFVFFVLVPTLFVLSFLFTGWGDLQAFVFRNANVMAQILSAILEQIDIEYEIAARTLGASPLTASRTVTLPLFRSGIATGSILCLAKALSDTGGVQAALQTANLFAIQANSCSFTGTPSGTVLIGAWRTLGKACPAVTSQLNAGLAFVAILMIALSIGLLYAVKFVALKVRFPLKHVWPGIERKLSRGTAPRGRDLASFAFLVLMILIPSFFLVSFLITGTKTLGSPDWGTFGSSLGFSFLVAGLATLIDLMFGVPLALYITRGPSRRFGSLLDSLVNIPYIVPSAALGFSLFLFWKPLVDSGTLPILAVI